MPSQTSLDIVNVRNASTEYRMHCNGQVLVFGGPSDLEMRRTQIERSWTTTANFLALRRQKKRLPDLWYNYQRYGRSESPMTYVRRDNSSSCPFPNWDQAFSVFTTVTHPGTYVAPYGAERLTTSAEAVAKLFSRAKGAEFSMPVFLGEARETCRMVLGTAKTLADTFLKLRRGNLKGAFATLQMGTPTVRLQRSFNRQYGTDARKAAANHWLAMQYGWKPLLADVKNAAEQLGEFATQDVKRVGRVTSRANYERWTDQVVTIESSPSGTARRKAKIVESYRYTWLFSPAELNNLGSLGLLNPLSVAWELTPLSFVVDWMLPIGRYLEHLDVPLRFNHLGGTAGYARWVESTFSEFVRDGVTGIGPNYTTSWLQVSRDPLGNIPHLGLDSIRFEPNLGVQRMLSGLALASQAFKR